MGKNKNMGDCSITQSFFIYVGQTLVMQVVEFSNGGYKIRNILPKGPSLYYVRVFLGFSEPPTHLRKDIFGF